MGNSNITTEEYVRQITFPLETKESDPTTKRQLAHTFKAYND
ncbi:hypothetical protein [Sporosarcina sp. P13]|nr:hypothetical protein [Sporosarcina sp. P13]